MHLGSYALDPSRGYPVDARSVEAHQQAASQILEVMQANKCTDETVCACCNRYSRFDGMVQLKASQIPNLQLLRTAAFGGSQTDAVPRNGRTVWRHDNVEYCMQSAPEAKCIKHLPGETEPTVQLCEICVQQLRHRKLPSISLARLDPGRAPADLPQLTWVEAVILSPYRAVRHIVVCKPPGKNTADVTCFKGLRGHVVAVPQSGPGTLMETVFPCPMENLPDVIQVSKGSRRGDRGKVGD